MRLHVFIFLLLTFYPASLFAQPGSDIPPIDQELVKQVDVTGDGKPETIILHLKAKNIKAPIAWTLTIISEGKQIYSYTSDDSWLDKFFNDVGYVLDCKDYISCKKKYYYHDILDDLVLTGDKWYQLNAMLDTSQSSTLYPVGRSQLKECCNISGQQADAILNKIAGKFKIGKIVAIIIPVSPVQSMPALIFVPEVGRFIRFYED